MTSEKLLEQLIDSITEKTKKLTKSQVKRLGNAGNFEELIAALPSRFSNATLENFVPPNELAKKAIDCLWAASASWISENAPIQNVLILGPPGRGKDHILVGLAKLVSLITTVKRITGFELFEAVRKSFSNDDGTINHIKNVGVLILSDLGQHQLTSWQKEFLHALVDFRWSRSKAIWLSSNYCMNDLCQALGPATVDRLIDNAIVIEAKWNGWRKPAISIS